ncbi:MAG: carbamoyltransferase family protein [Planctomycetota bacterium]
MIILGITRDVHDPSAALVVDGKIVAAAEEERFTRVKHAPKTAPARAARFCLQAGGIEGRDVDRVAYPWSLEAYRRNRWVFARRTFSRLPRHAVKAVLRTGSRWRREMQMVRGLFHDLGIDPDRTGFLPVAHHLAHAASAYFASGLDPALVLTADAMGEFDAAGAWTGSGGRLDKIWELLLPHSLGTFYTAVTEFLGFEPNDGEFKTMGLAAYGDPQGADLSDFCSLNGGAPKVDPRHVFPPRKYRRTGRYYSDTFVQRLGPPGMGEAPSAPYTHIAAHAQALVEEAVLGWLRGPLHPALETAGGTLCLAGGIALNVKLNGRILEETPVRRIWVQPAAHDAGGSLGAALWAASQAGDAVPSMPHAFLGPVFDETALRRILQTRRLPHRAPAHLADEAASILARGETLGRFDGPMEWGPRALGNRSILAHPGLPGMAERINRAVKFREPWRPFCPSVLHRRASEVFRMEGDSPYMTLNVRVEPPWRERIPEVVHVDGTARIQTVDPTRAPGFHALLEAFEAKTGLPVLLNTSLNRRGEPMACTPEDALKVFFESGLDHLILGPFLLSKRDLGKGKAGGREGSP